LNLRKIQSETDVLFIKLYQDNKDSVSSLNLPSIFPKNVKELRTLPHHTPFCDSPIPSGTIPPTLKDAMNICQGSNVVFYLQLRKEATDLDYDPYDFRYYAKVICKIALPFEVEE